MLAVMEKEELANKESVDKFNKMFKIGDVVCYNSFQASVVRKTKVFIRAYITKSGKAYFGSRYDQMIDLDNVLWKKSKAENTKKRV